MNKISNMQIYCLLHATMLPIAFLIIPMVSIHTANSGAWAAFLVSVLPTILLAYLYIYIVKNSSRPFPATLEEHLGKVVGKILGFLYILVFLFSTIFSITYFTALISSSIVPDTPLSVYIAALLLASYYALKTGMENVARVIEIVIILGFIPALILVLLGILQSPNLSALVPVIDAPYSDIAGTIVRAFFLSSELIAVLTLAFFSNDRNRISRPVNWVVVTYAGLITLTTAAILMNFGPNYTNHISFPTLKLVRSIKVSDFIQNIDIVLICVLILGTFTAMTVKWFLACYSMQQVFGLRDYRFLAAPSSVAVGIGALMLGKNIVAIQLIVHHILPYVYGVFFVLIPFMLFILVLFKPSARDSTDLPSA